MLCFAHGEMTRQGMEAAGDGKGDEKSFSKVENVTC